MGKIDPRLNDKLNDAKPSFKKPKKNLIYYFQPVGASVGITASTLFANLPHGLEWGSSLGVVGELHFMKNVHLQLGVERMSIGFKLEDDGIVGSYPFANPDDPSDVLHEIKGNLSYLQIPIELKKMFRAGKKIQPYFHFGLSAVRPLKQNFDYEYKSFPGEYKTQLNLKDGAFSIGHLRGGIGGAFSFGKKYIAGMGVYYQHGLEIGEGEYFKLRYWGLQANLKYQLF